MRIYDDPDYQIIVQKLNKEDIFYKVGEIQTNDKQSSSGIIDSFIDCIINDKNPAIGGEEGVKSIKIVAAAIEAAKTGRTVKVQK
jgi:predicted dehydrogenase